MHFKELNETSRMVPLFSILGQNCQKLLFHKTAHIISICGVARVGILCPFRDCGFRADFRAILG